MQTRVLVVDIGNTSTSVGIFTGARVQHTLRLANGDTTPRKLDALMARLPKARSLAGAAVACVVPTARAFWDKALQAHVRGPVHWVDHTSKLGLPITYPEPDRIGADRLANACGAVTRYGAPVIVADFGTALTFDVVSRAKGYLGGVIAPGLPLMFTYLAEKTALLPQVDLGPVRHRVGKSTEEAMKLGARWGYRGMVREIIHELRREVGPGRVTLCATGGFAAKVVRGMKPTMVVDRDLTLFGLGQIFLLNTEPKAKA